MGTKMEKILNYIDGKLLPPQSGHFLNNETPATGQVYSFVPDSDERDVAAAIEAAKSSFPIWSKISARERAKLLRRLAGAIENHLPMLAEAESLDSGKSITAASQIDIPRSAYNFEFFADAATQFSSESHSGLDPHVVNYTLREPLGVVGCISPWNLPLYLLTWKIAPALAAGNCVVAKPSEVTPMSAFLLSKICAEIGFPKGVLNIVHGLGKKVGEALCQHPEVKAISFTGSTFTGAEIAKTAAPHFKKLSLEMGGKNPTLVFADCDFEKTVEGAVRAAFTNQGQVCLCGSRILIERSIYEKFKEAFVERVKKLKLGDPQKPETEQGALVSKSHCEKVLSYIEIAKSEGGKILCGGERTKIAGRCEHGYFVAPTVMEGLDHMSRTNQEEIFGPVVTLSSFQYEKEAVEWANSTRYGLAASVWTSDASRAHRIATQLQSGIVWINTWMLRDLRTPFGGTKDSGLGREGGLEALRFFTEPKNVCVKF